MSRILNGKPGQSDLLMGNDAIARGALEAGMSVCAGYPGTPSSEIVQNLADCSTEAGTYVEWSTNEKLALEVAAAASFAGLRSLAVMKQNGVNVASDFLLHLAGSGIRGGMVLVACDDPGALSSVNEGESRHFAHMVEVPLLEPGDFQEAKDIMAYAYDLSEELGTLVMVRSVTRLSHASGPVTFGELPTEKRTAYFSHDGFVLDPANGPVISAPVAYRHHLQQDRIKKAAEIFEECPFNTYSGSDNPELLIITSSAASLYTKEAVHLLAAADKAGILKLATTWPLPPKLLTENLKKSDKVLIVEEVLPFLEEQVKVLAAELAPEIGVKQFFGKRDCSIPSLGELNPDLVMTAIAKALGMEVPVRDQAYVDKASELAFFGAPNREQTFCPGCPHRASFWGLRHGLMMDGRKGFVCGDIGCYSMAMLPCGFSSMKTLHAMGSGTGLASGFGKLGLFGMDQPILAVCGDSTFFHAVMPALVNAVHNEANITLVVLDNSGTGMTGFQPHPGRPVDAKGGTAPALDIEAICLSMGANVVVRDPFAITETRDAVLELMETPGVNVLILRQICALSPEKKHHKMFEVSIDPKVCLGGECGCNRLCTRVFACPGLIWDAEAGTARIDEVICAGCGVCASICPSGAISKKEVV